MTAVVFITLIIVGLIVWYCRSTNVAEEEKRTKIEIDRKQRCEKRLNELMPQITEIYKQNANVEWGTAMRKSTISRLIALRYYYDKDNDSSYISLNLDSSGLKAVYQEKNGVFEQIRREKKLEDPTQEGLRSMVIIVGLGYEPQLSAINSFNDMERPMPELKSLPCISFGY